MDNNTEFIAITLADNTFSSLLYDSCKTLLSFFESQIKKSVSKYSEYIKLYIASSIARLYALENQITHSTNTINYNDDYYSLKEYLYNNITITYGINNIIKLLSENVHRKYAAHDLRLADTADLTFYLKTNNNNYAIIPCLYWCNNECIIMRICRDNSCKSQMILI